MVCRGAARSEARLVNGLAGVWSGLQTFEEENGDRKDGSFELVDGVVEFLHRERSHGVLWLTVVVLVFVCLRR